MRQNKKSVKKIKKLIELFSEWYDFLNKKKKPTSDCYPYEVHDPYAIFDFDPKGLKDFYLVGDNWIDSHDKEILVVLGCNDWKFGFIADYFKDFRVAFAGRKEVGWKAIKKLRKLSGHKPHAVVIWGYTDRRILRWYLKLLYRIPIWRIEDGFIRSAALGAEHTVPYSLVVDKTGLYYNCYTSSDIENILNNYDFKKDEQLLKDAEIVKEYLQKYKVSKYNPPIQYINNSIKLKKRVLVIGQVDNDASLRYGNPDQWTMEDMLRLAKYENKDAEILYRPHPEVYRGFQKSKLKKKNIEHFVTIVSADENIIDLIERVDHIYTLTSLTGLEALIRGKKVTVLGAPFYAGWGLTDDRCTFSRRIRKLSLDELISAVYLLYPKYLGNIDSYTGFFAGLLSIVADRRTYNLSDVLIKNEKLLTDPILLFSKVIKNKRLSLLNKSLIEAIFTSDNNYYNEFLLITLLSVAQTDGELDNILSMSQDIVSPIIFNNVLLLLEEYKPGNYLVSYWTKLFIIRERPDLANKLLNKRYKKRSLGTYPYSDLSMELVNSYDRKYIEDKFILSLDIRDYESSKKYLTKLVLCSGIELKESFRQAIRIAEQLFDFDTVLVLSKILKIIDIYFGNRFAVLAEFRAYSYCLNISSDKDILESVASLIKYKSDKIMYAELLLDNLNYRTDLNIQKSILHSVLKLDNEISVRKVNALMSIESFGEAERLAYKLIEKEGANDANIVCLSQALSYNNKKDKSIEIIEDRLDKQGLNKALVTELMRLYVLDASYKKSYSLLLEAQKKGIEIGEMHRRKCFFGNRLIFDALETFKDLNLAVCVKKHYPNKYVSSIINLKNSNSVFILSIFGPGDEIRFASSYTYLSKLLPKSKIVIACAPRLYSLFSRSFPALNFVAVEKPRNGDLINLENYTKVPSLDISAIIDNNAVNLIEDIQCISIITSLLSDIFPSYNHFIGSKYIDACEDLVKLYREKLLIKCGIQKTLIGLSWRSGLTSSARNEHYLSIEELEKLFTIPNAQFVNLQYDECDEELKWVNQRYPGKIINVEDLDQYNDFDGVAALMANLDLIIAPATTVVELAGALGVKTWLFSNSSEIDWRKKDDEGTDVWHNSVTIVDVPEKGDKSKLVEELYRRLQLFVSLSKK